MKKELEITVRVNCSYEKLHKETSDIYLRLTKLGLNISMVSEQKDEYHGGLCIMHHIYQRG